MTLPASYATVVDVWNRYPPMGSVTAVTSAHIALAIGAVQARIDSVLSRRYAVPFSPVPPVVEMIAGDLACLRLIETRIIAATAGNQSNKANAWTVQFQSSVELLEKLACGEAPLISGSGTTIGQSPLGAGEVWSTTMTSTPTFIGQDWADVPATPDPFYEP